MTLADISSSKKQFFVRVEGKLNDKFDEVKKAFGNVEVIMADGLDGEFGVITEMLSEAEYEEAAKNVNGIINRIRIEK